MQPRVYLAHHTRDRVRLRIPGKRRDLQYFLDLYEELREIPGVSDVVINPTTGSVLLHLAEDSEGLVFHSLKRLGLLDLGTDTCRNPGVLCRLERFLDKNRNGAAGIRTILFGLVVALAIQQVRSGKLLIPALSVFWYAYDLMSAPRR